MIICKASAAKVGYVLVVLVPCCNMSSDWQKVLVDALVPAEVAVEVCKIYGSPRIFQYAFRTESALDKFIKSLVMKLNLVREGDEAGAEVHPAVGAVRAYCAGLLDQDKGAGRTEMTVEKCTPLMPLALPASSKIHAGDRGANASTISKRLSRQCAK